MQTGEAYLSGVLEQVTRLVRQIATTGDLSLTAAMVMARLAVDGPQRLTELAVAEGLSQPGMTQLVTRLERDGLVRRMALAGDRRGVLVAVTEAGGDLVASRRAERADALQNLLHRLDPADQEAIAAALPALNRLAEAGRTRMITTPAATENLP
jgi:DNA-binding MarR family transcriptional regulator